MKNQLKTVVLLAVLTAILLWIGSFWGRAGLTFAISFSLLMNIGSYWFSDKIVLKMYKAKEAGRSEYSELHRMVERISKMAGIPKPKVYIIPSEQPNAFATGRNPKHAAVAYTTGILKIMDKKELEGVTAHELAHVQNRDILVATVAATIAGVISYVAMVARWGAMFGIGGKDRNGNILELLVLAIVTPIIAAIIQLAISRAREFHADATGAGYLRSGQGLASGLQKLESYSKRIPMRMGTDATASMFIVNPFSGKAFVNLFSTHPSTEERVKRLKKMRF